MMLALAACGKQDNTAAIQEPEQASQEDRSASDAAQTDTQTAEPAKQITITFRKGDEVLGTVTANAGELLDGYQQFENVEGFIFQGWYKTPTLLEASYRDLTKETFKEDTKLFGSFKSAQVTEDTRSWYIVGEGTSPVLSSSAWAGSVEDSVKEACRLNSTGDTNTFSITLDLYAGDKFQVISDWCWDSQHGFGFLTEYDDTQMESGGGLSDDKTKTNIAVNADGSYCITLVTDPEDPQQDIFSIVRVGDAVPADELDIPEAEPYVVTEATNVVMKGSWVADWSENVFFERTEADGRTLFTCTYTLAAGTELYFMVWDGDTDTGIGMNSSAVTDEASKALLEEAYNVKVAEDGDYTFIVDVDALSIVISK